MDRYFLFEIGSWLLPSYNCCPAIFNSLLSQILPITRNGSTKQETKALKVLT